LREELRRKTERIRVLEHELATLNTSLKGVQIEREEKTV
jgi:hypothetical protein